MANGCRRYPEFAACMNRPAAPCVPVHQFEPELQFFASHCVLQGPFQQYEFALARKRLAAAAQAVACPGRFQVGKQRCTTPVGHGQMIDIQYRVAQSGRREHISKIVHVDKRVDVQAVVDMAPCPANFRQAVRSES